MNDRELFKAMLHRAGIVYCETERVSKDGSPTPEIEVMLEPPEPTPDADYGYRGFSACAYFDAPTGKLKTIGGYE